jgi:hypothetical protein
MNNRETVEPSPDACNPESQNEKRQRQRQTDPPRRRAVAAAGGQRGFAGRNSNGSRLLHIHVITIRGKQQRPRITEAFVFCP